MSLCIKYWTFIKTKEVSLMLRKIKAFIYNEKGQTMVEYAILAAFLIVILIGVVSALSGAIGGVFEDVTGDLTNPN